YSYFIFYLYLFYFYIYYLLLYSFPTRRSSDLRYTLEEPRIRIFCDEAKILLRCESRAVRGLLHQSGGKRDARFSGVTWTEGPRLDRKSTRLNSSHQIISYAVFCLKKKKKK